MSTSFAHAVAQASRISHDLKSANPTRSKTNGASASSNGSRNVSMFGRGKLASMLTPNFGPRALSSASSHAATPASSAPFAVAASSMEVDLTVSPIKAKAFSLNPTRLHQPGESKTIATSSTGAAPPLQCMLCGASLAMVDLDERNRHINRCLDQLTGGNSSSDSAGQTVSAASRGASTPAKSMSIPTVPSTSVKRKRDPAEILEAPAALRQKSAPDVCVIEDDAEPMVSRPQSASAASPRSFPAASTPSSVRRAITDFFGGGGGGGSSNSGLKKSVRTPSPASSVRPPPKFDRAQTMPAAAASSNSAPTETQSSVPSASAPTSASPSMLIAEKTKDVWNLLLTGRGNPAHANGKFAKNGAKGNGNGFSSSSSNGKSTSSSWGDQSETMRGSNGERVFKLPSFKLLPETNIAIDAFMHTRAVLAAVKQPLWFLSHFHADHYMGMSAKWNNGPIYCSEITARLVRNAFGQVPVVVPLPLHERIELSGGVRVTFIDAHHCPGAVIAIFETAPLLPAVDVNYDFLPPEVASKRREEEKQLRELRRSAGGVDEPAEKSAKRLAGGRHGKVYVHGGDMRYHSSMRDLFLPPGTILPPSVHQPFHHALPHTLLPHLPSTFAPCPYPSLAFRDKLAFLHDLTVDTVYLDTTYCNPRYRFPPQAISIAHTLAIVGECLAREQKFGVSSLVDKGKKSNSGAPIASFFRQFAGSTSAAEEAAAKVAAQQDVGEPSAHVPGSEGLASFLTQAGPNDSFGVKQEEDLAGTERQDEEVFDGEDDVPEGTNEEFGCCGGIGDGPEEELKDDSMQLDAAENEISADGHVEDEELEDLMMRDYDRPDEDDACMDDIDEDDGGVPSASASSSSTVGQAISNVWSSVTAGVSSLSKNIALSSSSFLSGYKQQAVSKTLFLVGSYSIGKEKIFIEIAKQYGLKIYVPSYRLKTMKMLDLFDDDPPANEPTGAIPATCSSSASVNSSPSKAAPVSTHFSAPAAASASVKREWKKWHIDNVVTTKIHEARLHVVPLSCVNQKAITQYLDPALNKQMPGEYIKQFHQVVAFRPTGWVGNKPTRNEKTHTITVPAPTRMVRDTTPQPQGRRGKPKLISVTTGAASKHSLHVAVHGIPYSEHSTFPELSGFVETLAACGLSDIIPTVNVSTLREVVRHSWGHLLHPRNNHPLQNTNPPLKFTQTQTNTAPPLPL